MYDPNEYSLGDVVLMDTDADKIRWASESSRERNVGLQVRTLVERRMPAGHYIKVWQGTRGWVAHDHRGNRDAIRVVQRLHIVADEQVKTYNPDDWKPGDHALITVDRYVGHAAETNMPLSTVRMLASWHSWRREGSRPLRWVGPDGHVPHRSEHIQSAVRLHLTDGLGR